MTIEDIKMELMNKVIKLNGTHNIFQQGEKHQCELVLIMISKLNNNNITKVRFCTECGNTKSLQGKGIIEQLCTCKTTT